MGVAGALVVTSYLSSLLFGVKPDDPLTFAAVSLLLLVVALLRAYIPARRATRVMARGFSIVGQPLKCKRWASVPKDVTRRVIWKIQL
jgi:hypothetical protein